MTLNLHFTNKDQVEEFMMYVNGIYKFVDLDREHIPGVITVTDPETVEIYVTDAFFRYSICFLYELLMLNVNKSDSSKVRMENLAKKFRHGCEEYLMNNILLE